MNDVCNWRKIEKNYLIAKRVTIRQGRLIGSASGDLYKRNILTTILLLINQTNTSTSKIKQY